MQEDLSAQVSGPSTILPRGYLWIAPVWYLIVLAALWLIHWPPAWFRLSAAGGLLIATGTFVVVLSTISIRAFAADQQEPATREQLFLRAAWSDAFVPHLELSGFALVNLYDRSRLVQLGARYDLSERWTLAAYLSANLGAAESERGSLPQAASAVLQAFYYF